MSFVLPFCLLQKWSTDFDPAQRSLLPVWVEFPSLPLVFFPHIEKIAAMSGRVLCSEIPNGFVARPTRRICVELSSSQDLPDFIELKKLRGQLFQQRVSYLTLPNSCYYCHDENHRRQFCRPKGPRLLS